MSEEWNELEYNKAKAEAEEEKRLVHWVESGWVAMFAVIAILSETVYSSIPVFH